MIRTFKHRARLFVAFLALLTAFQSFAAVSYTDKYFLGQNATFQKRVRAALIANAVTISNEALTVAFHYQRVKLANAILLNADLYVAYFTPALSTDATIIADATSSGTIAIPDDTTATTRQASVTDAHIDGAIAAQFNFFFVPG